MARGRSRHKTSFDVPRDGWLTLPIAPRTIFARFISASRGVMKCTPRPCVKVFQTAAHAREIAFRTAERAIAQAGATDDSFGALREKLTSRGGTTEAALTVLDRRNTGQASRKAIHEAYARAMAISDELCHSDGDK